MISPTGSLVRNGLAHAEFEAGAAIMRVRKALRSPPEEEAEVARLKGGLVSDIYKIGTGLEELEEAVEGSDIMQPPITAARQEYDQVLHVLEEEVLATKDGLEVTLVIGRMLPGLRRLKEAFGKAEAIRHDNSNMRRA